MDEWRESTRPPLLTIRDITEYSTGGSIWEECVDFSFSRDGAHLVVEAGYMVPEKETPDGLSRKRARGTTVFEIPEARRGEVRAILEKAEGLQMDWVERCTNPDGGEELGFMAVERMDIGVDEDDARPSADDLRAKAASTGVKAGDIILSFCGDVAGVDFSKRTLRESCGEYSRNWKNSDGTCWVARMAGDDVEVFTCDTGSLFQCEIASGTAFLRVAPKAFDKSDMDRIGKAFAAYLESHPVDGESE